ncbi:unnamed protein product [Prunus armeniaca]
MLSTTPGAYTLVALSEHPYDIGGSHKAGIRLLKDNLRLREKGIPGDSTNMRGRSYCASM